MYEDGKILYIVQPVLYMELTFNGHRRLVKAINHRLRKTYRGKALSVFTTDYDLFNKYYRQALDDLTLYVSDHRYAVKDAVEGVWLEPVKREPSVNMDALICITDKKVVTHVPNIISARKTAMQSLMRGARKVEIWKGTKFIGEVYTKHNTFIFRTKVSEKVLKSDGTFF